MQTKHILIAVAALAVSACHKDETVHVSDAQISAGQTITSDTLTGSVKGTLGTGKTYYFRTDITINEGDTLLMQAGSKLIALGDGKTTATSPQITCNGTFISLGTADANNFITIPDSLRKPENIGKGYWGGIQCGENSGDVIIKWTHLEYAGGPAGPSADPAVFAAGDPRNLCSYTNYNGHFILEDSWLYGSTDDGIRILHGNVSVMRNTFEANGLAGGEALNLKAGSVGDVAYNLVIGAATNAFKVSNSGGGPIQTNVYLYNNTMLNCGMRQVKSGRGGSIDYEKGAQGKIYNNIIINCRYGMRITPDADTAHTRYDYQFFYSNANAQFTQFYTSDGVGSKQAHDVMGTATLTNDPQFADYSINQFDFSKNPAPLDISQMPFTIITAQQYNFTLLPGSPALKVANADIIQSLKSVPQGGLYGATTISPSVDMGAYPSNNSGNLHFTSSLPSK